jgi:hypothetical protein
MPYLLCLVVLLGWASAVMGESEICVTKLHTVIGITQTHLAQGHSLIVDNDWPAFRTLESRGLVLLPGAGIELRVSEIDDRRNNVIVAVRRQGSPDTFYTYRLSLECSTPPPTPSPTPPKSKKSK